MKSKTVPKALSRLLPFVAIFILFCNEISAQKINLNFKNTPLKTILAEVNRQTGYDFVFSNALKTVNDKVTISYSANGGPIEKLFNVLFSERGISYKINNKQVILAPKEIVPGNTLSGVDQTVRPSQDSYQIKGRVIEGTNLPIPGVTVQNLKSKNISVSDNNGNYSIEVRSGDRIRFSSIGMTTKEIVVSGNILVYNIEMAPDNIVLQDVVVTGYQSIERGRATGSFDVVKTEALNKIVSNNIVDKLEGIVPGLAINSNGEMMIRGQATIYAQTKPLVVVDGFPMEYGTQNINPNDIESISVLKDAASASIWGVRAANGVIVITTKKASKNQEVKVSYTGNLKIGSIFDISSLRYLNTNQQVNWEREKFANFPTSISNIGIEYPSYFSEAAMIEYRYQKNLINNSERESEFSKLSYYDNTKEIQKYFYQNPMFQTHNIVVSGGTETITNYFSLNFENSSGDLKGNNKSTAGVQLNSTFDLSKSVKLTTGFRGNYNIRDSYTGSPYQMLPYVKIKDDNGNYVNEYYGTSQLMKQDRVSKGFGDWSFNRLKDRPLTDNNTVGSNVAANLQLDISLMKNLKFTTSGMFIADYYNQEIIYDKSSYYVRNLYNVFTSYSGGILKNNLPEGAIKSINNGKSSSYTFRNLLSYNYDKKDFNLNLIGGCEMFAIRTKTATDTFYGYDPQGMNYNSTMNFYTLVNEGVPGYSSTGVERLSYLPAQTDKEDRYFSTFFTGSLSYTNRYTFFSSVRYDKTNLYGRSSKYRDQPTWSLGAKWNLSKENFFKLDKIDLLTVKLSYGLSGNVDKSTSPYLIAANSRDALLGLPVLTINNPANEQLAWEKVYTLNAGLEMAMFKNRLNISADYYIRNTRDALGNVITDPTSGWESVKKNTASLTNKGLDLSINSRPFFNQNWSWFSTITFSYNYNEVTKVNVAKETVDMIRSGNPLIGKPVDYIYAYRNGGLNSAGQLQVLDKAGSVYLFNATTAFTPEDLLIMGRLAPKYFGSWSNMISYKGFNFDMLLTYKLGHKILMPSIANAATDRRPYKTFESRWRKPGDENKTWIPAANYQVTGQYFGPMNNNEKMIENGDIIRLKAIGISYDLKRVFKTKAISECALKFSIENPCFWVSNSDGLDTDRLNVSRSSSAYLGDQPQYYTFTLNVKF